MWWKVGFMQRPAQWLNEETPKHLPKPNLHPKKDYGHCLVVCCLSDPLQLSESLQNHYIWDICSANRWDTPKLQCLKSAIVNKMGAILHHNTQPHVTQPTLQKLNELGYKVLPLPPYSPDLLPIDYHFFKHLDYFLQGKHFHNHQSAENAFLAFIKSWSMDFLH